MKNPFLSKLLLGFSAIALLIYGTIYACSDGDWGWFYDSNFAPETFVDKSYSPLFLSEDVFYGIGFDTEHRSRFDEENIADWNVFLGETMTTKCLAYFLTEISNKDVQELNNFLKSKKSNKFSEKWKDKININDSKTKHFLLFLEEAQALEYYSTQIYDSWNYDESIKAEVVSDMDWIKDIEKTYQNTKDPFLKNRYWFLVVKACFYSADPEYGVKFFNTTEKSTPKNTLYYRALSYLAGIEYKQKNYAKSNYLYSQVFDKCPSMRVVAAYNFHPQEEKDWKASLGMAKTNEEKAALWAIQGYYTDEEQAIAEIYKLQPKSEHLDYLLTRLINKQENKINRSYQEKTVSENKKNIHNSTIELVAKIAQSGKTAKPYLWNIGAGYLETLNGNLKQADKYYVKAESKMPQTPLAINQVHLLRMVNTFSKMEKVDSKNEKIVVTELNWLYTELPKANIENLRYSNASSWTKNHISRLYKSQGNKLMAELFNRDKNFYDEEKNLEEMKAFLSKPHKTAIEKIGVTVYDVTLADIYNYQAVMATFANKIPEAIELMKKTDNLQNVLFYGNPFSGGVKDCHDCDHINYKKKKYSQIDFLITLKKIQDELAKGQEVYSNSILLGNAYYNISLFGNARLFYETNISGYGYSPYDFRDKIRDRITDCSMAKMYYQKALESTKNKEQKAKCYYMLAKCERNEYYNAKSKMYENDWELMYDKVNFKAWNGFKTLKTGYSDTKYYKEVINECGYFKTYISQKK